MHPVIHDGLNQARIADFHRWAERDRLARASIQARRTRSRHGKDPAGGRGTGRRPLPADQSGRPQRTARAGRGMGARSLVIAALPSRRPLLKGEGK
jgi:hypothetical protein